MNIISRDTENAIKTQIIFLEVKTIMSEMKIHYKIKVSLDISEDKISKFEHISIKTIQNNREKKDWRLSA